MTRVRVLMIALSGALAPGLALMGACDTGTPTCTQGLTLVNGNCVLVRPDAGHHPDAPPDTGHETGPEPEAGPDAPLDTGMDAPLDTGIDSGIAAMFHGVTSVSPSAANADAGIAAATSLLVTWSAATDPTPASEMIYAIYTATSMGGESFASPTVKVTGQTSYILTGLTAQTKYYVVVRSINKAGVEDLNTVELSATPETSTTPPTFLGSVTAVPLARCNSSLSWPAATGGVTAAPGLIYQVYDADGQDAGTPPVGSPLAVTGYGETSIVVADPGAQTTPYHRFMVVAVDSLGNASQNNPVGDTAANAISFSASIGTFVANSCAPSCHTLNTTNKLSPTYDPGYAYESLTGDGMGVAAKVCKPTAQFFCVLDAGDCPAWQVEGGTGPYDLVVPTDPGCSVFYQVLNQQKMPPGINVQPVTACDVIMVHDWIAQGAPNN